MLYSLFNFARHFPVFKSLFIIVFLNSSVKTTGSGFTNSHNMRSTRHLGYTLHMVAYELFSFNSKPNNHAREVSSID